jgi:hypothetical protein
VVQHPQGAGQGTGLPALKCGKVGACLFVASNSASSTTVSATAPRARSRAPHTAAAPRPSACSEGQGGKGAWNTVIRSPHVVPPPR